MAHSKANEPVFCSIELGALTANTTRSFGAFLPAQHSVKSIHIVNSANITGHNTDRYSFVVNKGTIASPTAIGSLDLVVGTNLVANTPRAFDLSAVADATKELSATDVLHVVATLNGSAANTTNTKVVVGVVPVSRTRDVV